MNAKKRRTRIPQEVAAKVLFQQDRTCCVCRDRGLQVQIHHIDEDPSNHEISNLAVLCFEHHNDTQTTGGFGRKLSAAEVIEFRDDWVERVAKRRNRADEIASSGNVDVGDSENDVDAWSPPRGEAVVTYLLSLPHILRTAREFTQNKRHSGVTADMSNAFYIVTDTLESVLVQLASYYPPGHFGQTPVEQYFSEYLGSRFAWYRAIYEPCGPSTGGTMVSNMVSAAVMDDASNAVKELVEGLDFGYTLYFKDFNIALWREDWKAANKEFEES